MDRLTWDETVEPVSRDQILRRERGQGNINFPCSADNVQDWQPYPLIHTLAIRVTIHTVHKPPYPVELRHTLVEACYAVMHAAVL